MSGKRERETTRAYRVLVLSIVGGHSKRKIAKLRVAKRRIAHRGERERLSDCEQREDEWYDAIPPREITPRHLLSLARHLSEWCKFASARHADAQSSNGARGDRAR